MENKGTFIILLLIIVVLTVTIAAMAGFMLFSNKPVPGSVVETANPSYVPSDKEVSSIQLYEEKRVYNLKNDEEYSNPVIQIDVTLWYYNKIDGIEDVEAKITAYTSKIRETIGFYFKDITLTDIKNGKKSGTVIKDELKEEINELLRANIQIDRDIVYEVVFDEWFYQ